MKTPTILIILLFLSSFTSASQIIGTTYKLNNIEIAQFDLPDEVTWYNAKRECKELGKGWRLPTKDELNLLYKNKDKICGFEDMAYRSSTYWSGKNYNHLETSNEKSWMQSFANGYRFYYFNDAICCVRAVRSF